MSETLPPGQRSRTDFPRFLAVPAHSGTFPITINPHLRRLRRTVPEPWLARRAKNLGITQGRLAPPSRLCPALTITPPPGAPHQHHACTVRSLWITDPQLETWDAVMAKMRERRKG